MVEYNLSFRDVLPIGVTYNAGSTTPATFGEPTVITDPGTGQQTLIWRNVSDLAPGSTSVLRFTAAIDEDAAPVGTTVINNGGVYANSNPRTVPRFTAAGVPIPLSYTQSATDSAQTRVTALDIEKSEPSPEGELLRGVHDHTTVYTLVVTNNDAAATNGVQVVDLVPAGLEFLGCGGVDNTTTGPEYPGSGSLSATPAVTPCVLPSSVSTVLNPAGVPAGTYTRVVWTVGNMAPGATTTIRYAAGIPQRANSATWPGATPSPAGRGQTANLDNNTGPSTRETDSEQSLTNYASAQGVYTGPVGGGATTTITATDSNTVTAEDVRVRKTVTPGSFTQNGVARYTFTIDTSEYVDASDIVLTDHLPNGMCPLDNVANYVAGSPADCNPGAGFAPTNATITDVVQNADGSFDITFSPVVIDDNETLQISFSARMRAVYLGPPPIGGSSTSSGDSFTNDVDLTATTNPTPGVNPPDPGPEEVTDSSSVTLGTSGPSLDKTMLPNATPMDCSAAGYIDNPTPAQSTFTEGSRVCFKIRIDFATNVSTRFPLLTDFLPPNVTYDPGSAVETPGSVPGNLDDSSGIPVWAIGITEATGRYAPPGSFFEVVISGTVTTPGAGPAPDLTANLAKFRYVDGFGATVTQRDSVDLAGSRAAADLDPEGCRRRQRRTHWGQPPER